MGDEELVYHKQNGFLEIGVECLLHFVKSDQEGLVVLVLVVDYIPKVPVANGRRLPIATCQAVWHVYRDGVVVGSYASYRERFPVSNAYLPLFRRTAVDSYVAGADISAVQGEAYFRHEPFVEKGVACHFIVVVGVFSCLAAIRGRGRLQQTHVLMEMLDFLLACVPALCCCFHRAYA